MPIPLTFSGVLNLKRPTILFITDSGHYLPLAQWPPRGGPRSIIWVIFSKVCTLWVISVHAFFGQLQHHNLYFWWENNKNMSFPLKKNCFIVPWYTKLKYQILTWQKCPYRYLAKVGPPLQNLCNLTIGFIGGTIISVSIITITSASKKRNINYCLAIIA